MPKKTLVIGASDNPTRYSYLAVQRLAAHGHPVTALGKRSGQIGKIPIVTDKPIDTDFDTVSLYLNLGNQEEYYDYVLSLRPKRIIFNPGTENEAFAAIASSAGIQPMEACTLVLLSTGQF